MHQPAFFDGVDPPGHFSIRTLEALFPGNVRCYEFECVCRASIQAPTVPTLADVRRVERMAREHRGCAR
jgi:hypothetical protein